MAIFVWIYEHNILSWGSQTESPTLGQKSFLFSSDLNEESGALKKKEVMNLSK